MIKKILTCYAERLEEFLRADFPQPEGLVEVGFVGNGTEGKKNKLLVTPFGGDWFPHRAQRVSK